MILVMTVVNLKKGYNLHLKGGISCSDVTKVVNCRMYAVVPEDFQGIIPRMDVREGDTVIQGDRLFHDRRYTEMVVTSPVTGVVKEIRRGERRKIEAVIIERSISDSVKTIDVNDDVKSVLLKSGLWACFLQRPYAVIPSPYVTPRDIFVTAFDSAPLAPDFSVLLKEKEQFIQKGIDVLASLTIGKVYVGIKPGMKLNLSGVVMNEFVGPHPAGNVGVQAANIKPVNKGETVWTLDLVTVARIGELFMTGKVPYDTLVAVTGSEVKNPGYVKCIMGARIADLIEENVKERENIRVISGNVLSGNMQHIDGYLRFPYRHVTVIKELNNPGEFMGWASLSLKKFSVYRSFFSWLCPKKKVALDAKLNGGERAIVMAGEYDKMLPMDIYAEFLIKAIIAYDIDKMEQLGIYEVAPEDFALCEFADTSKLELQRILREGLDKLRKEME